jgi:hypothetical protein
LDDGRSKIEDASEKMLGSVRHEDDAQCLELEEMIRNMGEDLDSSNVSSAGSDIDFHIYSDMSPQQMNEVRVAMR